MEHRFPLPQTPFKNPEEEILHLRRLIAEKEKDYENIGLKKGEMTPTREVIASYKTAPPQTLHDDFALPQSEVQDIVLKLTPEEHDKQVGELVRLAKDRGIKNALAVVEKMQNFHLTDDFHRYLAEYLKEGFTIPGFNPKERISKGLGMTLFEILITESLGEQEA